MTDSIPYILISIVVFAIIAALVIFARNRARQNRLTPLAGLAFGFVIAGIIFGENSLIGYGLIGIGVILAGVDAILQFRKT